MLSSSSVYPEKTPDAFDAAAKLGYDGVEVMVYTDPVSQSGDALARLVDYHQVPVLAVHAPGLLLTQLVWGREPWAKLVRAKELAERLGAKIVVVHPPFRWQREYTRGFEEGIAKMSEETDVIFAVENMFPIRAGRQRDLRLRAALGSDQARRPERDARPVAHRRLRLRRDRDGQRPRRPAGAHPPGRRHRRVERPGARRAPGPGRGKQPCAELLRGIAATGYQGMVVAEVNTRHAATREDRLADLVETLAFARTHLAGAGHLRPPSPAGHCLLKICNCKQAS